METGKRIVFMGTSEFAAIILARLLEASKNIIAVYTQPDRAAGRGLAMRQSRVKQLAEANGMPVFQPLNFREPGTREELANLRPDFLIVASYGLILPQMVLDIPKLAPINIHASLLPHYRGAAPVQYAIRDNWQNDVTGVSIMRMEKGMDTGPVYASAEAAINGYDAAEMTRILAELGADLLLKVLPGIISGTIVPREQEHDKATYAAKLTREDGIIDWHWPARRVDSLIRAMYGWPGAHAILQVGDKEIPVTLEPGKVGEKTGEAPGTIMVEKHRALIACGDCWYELGKLRPQDRREMEAAAFFNGQRCGRGQVGRAL